LGFDRLERKVKDKSIGGGPADSLSVGAKEKKKTRK
jgi:hypothetical protein